MFRYLRDIQARRRGEELAESGFTLIELLIVIVVLGILAATVIFALGGVTGQSATAACQSDAKSYEIAVAAFENAASNSSNTPPATTSDLVPTYLHQAANSTHYVVALSGDTSATILQGAKLPASAAANDGIVYVGAPGSTLGNYDTVGCAGVS